MKQHRIRFKSRKKFVDRFNAKFKKLTSGFMEHHVATVNRSKHHAPSSKKGG
jgi:hypothetical protein